MIGNVWEWTGDKFGRYHDHEPDTDPSGSPRGQDYVKKGGSFLSDVDHSYRKCFKIYTCNRLRVKYGLSVDIRMG